MSGLLQEEKNLKVVGLDLARATVDILLDRVGETDLGL